MDERANNDARTNDDAWADDAPGEGAGAAPVQPGYLESLAERPTASVALSFRAVHTIAHVSDPIWEDVSCLALAGRSLFCTCDETASLERLVLDVEAGVANDHASFALGTFFDLPDGPEGEMDIEGIAIADGYVWVAGSHSLKRDKPKRRGLERMQGLDWDPNRGFLGRVPLADRGDGLFEPVAEVAADGDRPARTARMVPMTASPKTPIRKMLAKDPLIGPFVRLPCKENGLDVEGLAVRGNTVLLGLRGPVVGGYAILVRLEMKETADGWLKPRRLANGKRYAIHAVDLDGQGIRDLEWHGDRLFVLTGATTDLEALQTVRALAPFEPERAIVPAEAVERVLHLPPVRHHDHAEGIAVVPTRDGESLLVTHDSPRPARTDPSNDVLHADLFPLPPAGGG